MLTAVQLSTFVKGMSVSEFRQLFNIENDFTPEEEAEEFDENKVFE